MAKRKVCTKKETAFVDLWLKTGSMVDAYKGAYNTKMQGQALAASAKKVGRRPHVRALYDDRKAALDAKAKQVAEEKHGVTVDMIMREHKKLGFANMLDYMTVGGDGQPFLDFSKLTREQAAAISELTVETVMSSDPDAQEAAGADTGSEDGKRRKVAVLKTKFKLHDKKGSLDLMGKHLGMYAEDNKQKGEAEAEAAAASSRDLARAVLDILRSAQVEKS